MTDQTGWKHITIKNTIQPGILLYIIVTEMGDIGSSYIPEKLWITVLY
jgi:hypothetical protein